MAIRSMNGSYTDKQGIRHELEILRPHDMKHFFICKSLTTKKILTIHKSNIKLCQEQSREETQKPT